MVYVMLTRSVSVMETGQPHTVPLACRIIMAQLAQPYVQRQGLAMVMEYAHLMVTVHVRMIQSMDIGQVQIV